MPRGGKRQGAGRKPGSRDRQTIFREQQFKKAVEGKTLPLEIFMSLLNDPTQPPALRFAAAKEAAPYVHAKLSSVEARVATGLTHEERLAQMQEALNDETPPTPLQIVEVPAKP